MLAKKHIMKISIVISLLVWMNGAMAECDSSSAIVRGRCYEKEVLIDNLQATHKLVMDFQANVLYFTRGYAYPRYSIYYLDLNTNELEAITQLPYARALAIDQVRDEVYIAGDEGIYKFYHNNKTTERISTVRIIKSMFYSNQLYCTRYNGSVSTFSNGEFTEVSDMKGVKADFFVIAKDRYRIFGNCSGIFGKTKGSEKIDVYLKGTDVNSVTIDAIGNPYFCYRNRFYFINKDRKTVETIGILFDRCDNLTFDKDSNIIYSIYNKIIRLKLRETN